MIGKLRGSVDTVATDYAVIDVGGVGYEVACSSRTLSALEPLGGLAVLFIETYVREDAIKLYGFLSEGERGWFRLLQSVQGVGAKVALAILNTLDVATLANAIALQDKATIARAPGVGAKVALRIATELRDKAPLPHLTIAAPAATRTGSDPGRKSASPAADAVSALINLGYAPMQASAAVSAAAAEAGDTARAEDLIRFALKELGR